MPSPHPPSEFATARLRLLMVAADVQSFRSLAQRADVSDWAVQQLRRDLISQMRLETVQKLAIALQISLPELLEQFGAIQTVADNEATASGQDGQGDRVAALEAEYQRLQTQLEQQESLLQERFRKDVLAAIESWLWQWPTAVHAVENNPDLLASRLVPLVQPVRDLLEQWQVEAIAAVGDEVPYDPQQHQLMKGSAEPGTLVRVRYVGFRQGTQLLHRAKVSPVE